ncbi:MAG: ACT domain-containing protein [Chloroflexota bacterium]|nr:ACT domain-containing protein [Chloroflexota bacterium]
MTTELSIKVPNRAGQLAAVSTALGDADVNIQALAGSAMGSKGVIHIVVADKDAARARRALKKAKLRVASDRKLVEVRLSDKPGTLARVATRLGKGRVSVESAYMTGTGKRSRTIGFGVRDARKAKKALGR